MRFFLAALTVGAAGIGYVYLHESDVHSAETAGAPRSLFDWQSANDPVAVAGEGSGVPDDKALVIRDTVSRARSEITSTLDEFVRTNVEAAASPVEVMSDIVSQAGVSQTRHTAGEPEAAGAPVASPPAEADRSEDVGVGVLDSEPSPVTVESRPEAQSVTDRSSPLSDPTSSPSASSLGPTRPSINGATLLSKKPTTTEGKTGSAVKESSPPAARNTTELLPGKPSGKERPVDDSGWTIVGRSARDLPLHTRKFGREGTRTLVIAGLDGRDVVAVRWSELLASALPQQPDLFPANEVLIFRAGNPDGLVKTAASNSRGVMINRNFPSRRYQMLPDGTSGRSSGSEAETKVILDTLYTFRPRCVIHLTSTTGPSRVYYNRAAKGIAAELEQTHKLEIQPLDVEVIPGSLEDFADGTLDAAVISIKLSTGSDWQRAWTNHLPSVLTAIKSLSVEKMRAVSAELARSADGTRIPEAQPTTTPARKIRRGFEELPPPPR